MELELQRQTLEGFRLIFDAALAQEETLECIVPDALPDVDRIVGAEGSVYLKSKEAGAGTFRLGGSVHDTVLYIPEGEGALPRTMEAQIPFQCVKDCPQLNDTCQIHVDASVVCADARDINPRKLLLRASLMFQVRVYDRELRQLTCDAEGYEGRSLEKQFVQSVDCAVSQVLEKPFLFSDVLHLPASKPVMEELLWARAQVGGAEAKVIGKKLICKGEIHLSAVYRNEASVLTAGFDLPFSQIFDLEEAMDECDLDLTVLITGMHCSLQEGELAVSLEALAQAELWIRRPVTLLADAYCTGCPLDVERAPCTLCVSAQHAERAETARQFCESGIPARQVLMCTAAVECVESKQEEGRLCCTARIRAEVLYLTEDSALCAVGYTLPVQCEIPVPEKTQCRCTCIPRGESTAVPVTGGLEVRCDVLFRWVTVKTERTPCVLSLKPGAVPAAQTPRPSLIVRMVGEGESLWEVAKSCGSTIHDIQAANELDGGPVSQGTLLLIPASRN